MKKYIKPEIRFMKTGITERIAEGCWGTNNVVHDKLHVKILPNGPEYTFEENKNSPYITGNWGSCTNNDKIPDALINAIALHFGEAVKNSVNSFKPSTTSDTGNTGLEIYGITGS